MIHDSFYRITSISDRQPNNDSARPTCSMHNTGSWDSILSKLIGENIWKSMTINILSHSFTCLLHRQNVSLSDLIPVSQLSSLF